MQGESTPDREDGSGKALRKGVCVPGIQKKTARRPLRLDMGELRQKNQPPSITMTFTRSEVNATGGSGTESDVTHTELLACSGLSTDPRAVSKETGWKTIPSQQLNALSVSCPFPHFPLLPLPAVFNNEKLEITCITGILSRLHIFILIRTTVPSMELVGMTFRYHWFICNNAAVTLEYPHSSSPWRRGTKSDSPVLTWP